MRFNGRWSNKRLTALGKITVIKSLVLPQLNHFLFSSWENSWIELRRCFIDLYSKFTKVLFYGAGLNSKRTSIWFLIFCYSDLVVRLSDVYTFILILIYILVPMLTASGTYAVLLTCVYVSIYMCVCDAKLLNTKF